ncbi:hypothetical protein D3C72_1374930 [compost metagenome]
MKTGKFEKFVEAKGYQAFTVLKSAFALEQKQSFSFMYVKQVSSIFCDFRLCAEAKTLQLIR